MSRRRLICFLTALVLAVSLCASALALDSGLKVTGATAFFSDGDGRVGAVILQRSMEILPEDTVESLSVRLLEDCEWPLLREAITLFCSGRLHVRGKRVDLLPPSPEETE